VALLGLAPGPIERVPADVAVVALFAGERPLRAAAGRVDWRLCGRLSHLFASGRLTGVEGEAVLIPGGGGMRAPRVMGVGFGERARADAQRWERWVADVIERAGELNALSAVIALPEVEGAVSERLSVLAKRLASCERPAEVEIAPEPTEAAGTIDWLRSAARRSRPGGLVIRPPGELPTPQGVETRSQGGWSSTAPAGRSSR
jgi:Cytosol aminopeptidase family, N-terminal domain